MEICDSLTVYNPTVVIPHTEIQKAQGEIGPEAQKKLRENIAKAEGFLLDLSSLPNSSIIPEIYVTTVSNANKELQLDIANVLQAVATLLQRSGADFIENILETGSDITEIPSEIRKKKEDENLIAESEHLIKQINIIKKCFNFLTPYIVTEINRIRSPLQLEFSIFKMPIEAYHAFYRKHFTMFDKISNSCEPLLEKLTNRIAENQNSHKLSDKSRAVLSYANSIESNDAKTTISNFRSQTTLITIIYNKINTVKKEMDSSYTRFKLKCNYFMHLCAFQKRPNVGYYSTVFGLHYPKWYNYLARETLLFSDDGLLIDMEYKQNKITKTSSPPPSKDQRSTDTSSSTSGKFEEISPISSNSPIPNFLEEKLESVDLNTSFSSDEESPSSDQNNTKSTPETFSDDDWSCLGGTYSTKGSSS